MGLKTYEEIVNNITTPTLVLAGPGAGKTYLLADRYKRLLDKGVKKENITVLTYGTDANKHMVEELIDPSGHWKISYDENLNISTMHSLGLSIVQEKPRFKNLLKTNLQVQSDEDVKKLMFRDAALICGFSEVDAVESIKCKQNGNCDFHENENNCKICSKYWEIMTKCNYIDFDDQILFACDILENFDDILEKYQSRCTHLLVDEYQDINYAQFRLIDLLSRKSRNGLFVVGDDAQSIYGFRGASPKFILNFKKDFEKAEIATLATSRRCHENIMEDAFKILEKYYVSWSGKPNLTYYRAIGDKPFIWQLKSEKVEAQHIARLALKSLNHENKKKVLILVSKKDQFIPIIEEFKRRGIPYSCSTTFLPKKIETLKHFFDWLKTPEDNFLLRVILENIINDGKLKVPGQVKNKRCTPETIEKRITVETMLGKLWENVDKKKTLMNVINEVDDENKLLAKIRDELKDLIQDYNNKPNIKFIHNLFLLSGIWIKPIDFAKDIDEIYKHLTSSQPSGNGVVDLNTMRKAKGLEADTVIITGCEDDIIPGKYGDVIENARLFYVSMTRAKEELYLFHSFQRSQKISFSKDIIEKVRSRFIDALGRVSEFKTY